MWVSGAGGGGGVGGKGGVGLFSLKRVNYFNPVDQDQIR